MLSRPLILHPFPCTGTPSLSSIHLSLDCIKRKEKNQQRYLPEALEMLLIHSCICLSTARTCACHSFPFPSHPHACAMPPSQGVSSSHLCRGRQQQRRTDVVGEHARWARTRDSGVDCSDTRRHGQGHQRRPAGATATSQVRAGGKSSSSSAWKTEARSGGCCGRSTL